uniref:Tight junction protein 3 n=1 Tax=Calidris pygmaea TaxID=425635 RepID=A0A8C3J4J6_9CHAR
SSSCQPWPLARGRPSARSPGGRLGTRPGIGDTLGVPCAGWRDRSSCHPVPPVLSLALPMASRGWQRDAGAWLICGVPVMGQQRKLVGDTAAKRSRSRSAPPAAGQGPPRQAAATAASPRLRWRVPTMEEMLIWEQHTVTLSKDPHRGFGFAVSGGRDRPNRVTGDTAVIVSDVVAGGPAMGRLQKKDHIVMVNGLSMENVSSSFAIQTLKTCGKIANIINGVPSEDMSLAETQQLIERTEGILTLLVLRDHRQFLVNIPDVEESQSDSSRMDDISDIDSELSHPPSPETSPRLPAAARMNSPPASPLWRVTRLVTLCAVPGMSLLGLSVAFPGGRYSADSRVVHFVKAKSVGLRLAGGNDVGIFVSSVQEGSPADSQGVREGDQILQVNDTSFQNLTREEAVEFLMKLPPGEDVTLWTQSKQDIYRKMISSNVGDSFYIRTHFDFEKDTPSGLSFVRGDVFHVLDTMYRGRLGSWLAVRMGRDLQEQDKGIIPNRSRAEQIASLESVLKATSGANPSGARAEFWKLRGLRGAKKMLRKSREDLSALTKQGHYPPYERVVLKEASFKRPVVILGPIADIAMQKLSTEMPEQFEIAPSVPRDGASSKVIKLDAVRQIAEKNKHALLDITPSAVERLNYVQYYPVVVFCEPESRQGIKAMRQWLAPDSRKSSRRLYAQASKMKKYCSHLFTATVSLSGSSNTWYEAIKDIIRMQQSQPVWTAAEQADVALEDSLDLLNPPSVAASGYLTCDSHANSDYDTDGETGAYTDGEAEDAYDQPGLARSSEPVFARPDPPRLCHPVPIRWERHHCGFLSPREYEHDAVRKRFTRARDDSDQDEGYEWGPATDV